MRQLFIINIVGQHINIKIRSDGDVDSMETLQSNVMFVQTIPGKQNEP